MSNQQTAETEQSPRPVLSVADMESATPPTRLRLRTGAHGSGVIVATSALQRVLAVAVDHGWEPQGTYRLTNQVLQEDGSVREQFAKGGGLLADERAGRLSYPDGYLRPRRRLTRGDAWSLFATLEPLTNLGGSLADDDAARTLVALLHSAPGSDIDLDLPAGVMA